MLFGDRRFYREDRLSEKPRHVVLRVSKLRVFTAVNVLFVAKIVYPHHKHFIVSFIGIVIVFIGVITSASLVSVGTSYS